MGRDCTKGRWEATGFYLEEADVDDKDEALSLCDLPVKLIEEENHHFKYERPTATESTTDGDDDDFDFGSHKYWTAQPAPEMCLADEVFFQGQILPVRLSVSSENSSVGLLCRHSRGGSGSESITRESSGKFRSINSSRSSSSRSHHSFSSINNSIAAGKSRPRVQNLFHSHPSPKPQVKADPGTFRQASVGGGRSQKSSAWEFFRLGVIKTPGMELRDLKHRSITNRNLGSRNKGGRAFVLNNSAGSSTNGGKDKEREASRAEARISMEGKIGILSGVGCKCSVETVAPKKAIRSGHGFDISAHAIREKAMREAKKNKKVEKEKEQQEKLALSRRRTFEWLKELSHASPPCEA